MIKRLNNKGNTLAIVLIGIFILSILGTLILGVTSTNYNMKLNDKKSEMVFYYSEKAADLLYTEIGNEVMQCVKNSYSDVLKNSISSATGTYTYNSKEELTDKFRKQYVDGKSGEFDGITTLYPKDATGLDAVLLRFESYVSSLASGYTFNVKKLGTSTPYNLSDDTSIEHVEKTNPVTGNNEIDYIKIKNVCIECTADKTGNYTNIVTDFVIRIPQIDIDFSDTKTAVSTDNLYSYAVIAQGKDITGDTPVLSVKPSQTANIEGNVYVGAGMDNNKGSQVTSVLVEANAKLNCKAQVLYSEGRFVIKEGSANLNSSTGLGEEFEKNTLQFYVNNISTEDDESTAGSGVSELYVTGNTIVKDDLEVNADSSKINLKGNYFGYGYRGTFGNDLTTGDTILVETNTDSTESDIKTIPGTTSLSYEHLESSAIIINAKEADVNLTALKNLLVAGRAYIDLDENEFVNTSYMTGESISAKGNQTIYQADGKKDDSGADYLPSNLQSGMSYVGLQSMMGTDSDAYYSKLGIDSDKVIAKNVNGKVYFYLKETNPKKQTDYFVKSLSVDGPIRNELRNNYKDMKLKLTLPSETSANIYTVGTYFGYSTNNFLFYPKTTMKSLDSTVAGSLGFKNLLKDINDRKDCLLPTLYNADAKGDKFLGKDLCEELPDSTTVATPYDYYLSDAFKTADGSIAKNVVYSGSDLMLNTIHTETGLDVTGKNVGYIVDNSGNTSELLVDLDIGVVITTRPVAIEKDFTGLIITGDKVIVKNDANIVANYNLAKILFSNSVDIDNILNEGLGSMVEEDTPVVQVNAGLGFEDLVEKSNWRKNVY